MPVKPISKERFEALCRSRLPAADYMSEEVEWFAGEEELNSGIPGRVEDRLSFP